MKMELFADVVPKTAENFRYYRIFKRIWQISIEGDDNNVTYDPIIIYPLLNQ